jgi:hypothetical protein
MFVTLIFLGVCPVFIFLNALSLSISLVITLFPEVYFKIERFMNRRLFLESIVLVPPLERAIWDLDEWIFSKIKFFGPVFAALSFINIINFLRLDSKALSFFEVI